MVLGIVAGTWGAHIPAVKARYALDDATLALVLLAAAIGAVSSLFVAGRIVGRFGARNVAALAALLMTLLLGIALDFPGVPLLMPAMALFGAAMSLFDVAINTEGSALESLGGRAIMSNLHGMFSVGGMAGAGLAAYGLARGVAPDLQIPAVCVGVALAAVATSRAMLDTHASGVEPLPQAHFAWPRGILLLIGLLILAGMTAEGAMYDWCVLYLRQDVAVPPAHAALGYATFSAAMALSRLAGDALRARWADPLLLRAGAALAALAMAIVLLSANAAVALIGFALVGAGLAPVAPILFNAASRVPGVSRAAGIAAVTSVGYAGFLVGPPLIGSIATASSLSVALGVVVVAAAILAYGARYLPQPRTRTR